MSYGGNLIGLTSAADGGTACRGKDRGGVAGLTGRGGQSLCRFRNRLRSMRRIGISGVRSRKGIMGSGAHSVVLVPARVSELVVIGDHGLSGVVVSLFYITETSASDNRFSSLTKLIDSRCCKKHS